MLKWETSSSRSGKRQTLHRRNMEIEYSLEATIATGNFENIRPGVRVSDTVPEGVKPGEHAAKVKKFVETLFTEQVKEIHADLRATK
jgi:hypothetical protein